MKIRLLVPQVNPQPVGRPKACPQCGGLVLHRHQAVPKAIIDTQVRQAVAVRYRCVACRHTFRHYPEGVSHYRQSQRVMGLAVLLWTLGLSEWGTSHVLQALEAGIHRSSVHRDRLRAGALLQRRKKVAGRAEVLGADETVVKVRGKATFLGVVVDGQSGETIGVDILVERDSVGFLDWLRFYTDELGVEVLVTDDLLTYKPVSEELGLDHQVCLTHVRKWVAKRLRRIEGWEPEKASVKDVLRELPPDGGEQLLELERRVRASPELRRLMVDLVQRWPSLVCYKRREGVPSTNNRTEQAIGKSKVRFKTVRGFKSMAGMLAGVALTQWLSSGAEVHDLRELVA